MDPELQPVIISAILITAAGAMLLKLIGRVERSQSDSEAFRNIFAALVLIACTISGLIAAHRIFPIKISTEPDSPFRYTSPYRTHTPTLRERLLPQVQPPPAPPEPAKLALPPKTLIDSEGRVCIYDIKNEHGIVLSADHDPTHYLSHPDLYVVGVHPSHFRGRQIRIADQNGYFLVYFPNSSSADRYLDSLIASFDQ